MFRFFKNAPRTIFVALALALVMTPAPSMAGPVFTSLSEQEFEDISKEFSGNFMHHSVQGAGTLGNIFGFELGLVAGQQTSPKINDIVKRSGGSDFSNLYHAGFLGAVSVPFGITGELLILPKISSGEADFQSMSAAVKLTMSENLLVIPFNLALRGFYSTSTFGFNQDSGGNSVSVENKTKVTGLQILVSPKLPLLEPYAGIGYVSSKNTLSANGAGLFAPGYTTSQSMEKSPSSTQILLGVTGNLLLFHIGAEYSNAFGASTYTGKLAFGF